jgi:lysophospholipase L1-like esterase
LLLGEHMAFGKLGAMGRGMGHLGALGGASDSRWRIGLAKLQSAAQAAANGVNSPSHAAAMSSPPTVSTSTNISLLSGITSVVQQWSDGTLVQPGMYGGTLQTLNTNYVRFLTSTPSGTTQQPLGAWRVERQIKASKVGFKVSGSAFKYRVLVDDQYVDLTGTDVGLSSPAYILVDFTSAGGRQSRKIAIEGQSSAAAGAIYVASGDTIGTVPGPDPVLSITLGDSFVQTSTGADNAADGFWVVANDANGFRSGIGSGVGSTGYLNDSSGGKYTLRQRLSYDLTGVNPDAVIVEMSVNDLSYDASAVAAEALLAWREIRTLAPAAPIFAIGPWDLNAPAAPSAAQVAVSAALSTAASGFPGLYYYDPVGISFSKADAVHPDTAGHATLGAWLAAQIKSTLGVSAYNDNAILQTDGISRILLADGSSKLLRA